MIRAPRSVDVVCSAGGRSGYGHLRRCMTLADALARRGGAIRFQVATDDADIPLRDELSALGSWRNLAAVSEAEIAGPDLLVLDSYDIAPDLEAQLSGRAGRTLTIEDLPDRAHGTDLVLDPTVGRARGDYGALLADETGALLGPRYTLLRAAFGRAGTAMQPTRGAHRVLIAFGGTDPTDASGRVVAALADEGIELDIVLGGSAPHLDGVGVRTTDTVRLHVDIDADTTADLMARADLCIGAGGGGAWERCAAGVPTLAYLIAENQRDVLAGLDRAGAIRYGGAIDSASAADIRRDCRALLDDPDARRALADAGRAVCDGAGADRVAGYLCESDLADGGTVRLRPAAPADCLRILDWQKAPGARRFARTQAVPTEAEHRAWFARRLDWTEFAFAMVEVDRTPAGFVRLDPTDGSGDFEVAILIDAAWAGRGVGVAALRLATGIEPMAEIDADVHPDNAASRRIFERAGFRPVTERLWRYGPQTDRVTTR